MSYNVHKKINKNANRIVDKCECEFVSLIILIMGTHDAIVQGILPSFWEVGYVFI
jgi:hypothetical protein